LDLRKASLKEPSVSMEEPFEEPVVGEDGFHVPLAPRRRRSASLSVLSSVSPSRCQTIEEEPVGEELQELLEGDR